MQHLPSKTTITFATFILLEDTLDPDAVTAQLSIQPSKKFKAGDIRAKDRVWEHGYWALTSEGQILGSDLAEHIIWLLEQLEPRREQLAQIEAEGIAPKLACFWSATEPGGPIFAYELLERLAALHIDVELDIYYGD